MDCIRRDRTMGCICSLLLSSLAPYPPQNGQPNTSLTEEAENTLYEKLFETFKSRTELFEVTTKVMSAWHNRMSLVKQQDFMAHAKDHQI